jgi:hypothetical protein
VSESAQPAANDQPAKAKPPALEEQPFEIFVPQLLIPALAKEIQGYGGAAAELAFVQGAMPVVGSECWMVLAVLHPTRYQFSQNGGIGRVRRPAKPAGVLSDRREEDEPGAAGIAAGAAAQRSEMARPELTATPSTMQAMP